MSEHTPSPWKVDADGYVTHRGVVIARVQPHSGHGKDKLLISAAPDLLAAAQAALEESEVGTPGGRLLQPETHDALNLAIAKATGDAR